MSYGISYPDLYRRAADYVVKILKGAKALGLTIPPLNAPRCVSPRPLRRVAEQPASAGRLRRPLSAGVRL